MAAQHARAHEIGPQEPLGKLLVRRGLIDEDQLRVALEEQRTSGEHLGAILIAHGFTSPALVAQALATQHGRVLKTEYGFATGFDSAVLSPTPAAEPPVGPAHGPASDTERLLASWQAAHAQIEDALAQRQAAYGVLQAELDQANTRITTLEAALASADGEPAGRTPAEPATHAIFFRGAEGYELLERDGPPPREGALIELPDGTTATVERVGRSAFPGAVLACVYVLS